MHCITTYHEMSFSFQKKERVTLLRSMQNLRVYKLSLLELNETYHLNYSIQLSASITQKKNKNFAKICSPFLYSLTAFHFLTILSVCVMCEIRNFVFIDVHIIRLVFDRLIIYCHVG